MSTVRLRRTRVATERCNKTRVSQAGKSAVRQQCTGTRQPPPAACRLFEHHAAPLLDTHVERRIERGGQGDDALTDLGDYPYIQFRHVLRRLGAMAKVTRAIAGLAWNRLQQAVAIFVLP